MNPTKLILASASPRRSEILAQKNFQFEIIPADIPEIHQPGESAKDFVVRLAREKAEHVAKRLISSAQKIIGADTVVVLDGTILGKPTDTNQAEAFLQKLSGKTHSVLTGFCIIQEPDTLIINDVCESRVTMRAITLAEIKEYVQTGEPMDKAGAYAAQGLGRKFIERIDGLESNVIGLPIEVIEKWIK